jgi:integrase
MLASSEEVRLNFRQVLMSAEDWIARANRRLGRCGVTLELSGKANNIYLRGTFPDKPWEGNGKRQRRLALKMKAVDADVVKRAETIARQVALDLTAGEFDWLNFSGESDPRVQMITIGDLAKELEREKRESGKVGDYTWRNAYEALIARLPLEELPSEDVLMAWVLECDPNASTMRRKYLSIAKNLLRLAGKPSGRLDRLARENQNKPINPRLLPSDAEITEIATSIENDEWRWVYGMLAVYGLRPHELFHLDLALWPDVRVLPDTKTGERLVPPVLSEWVDDFGLAGTVVLPSNLQWDDDTPNWKRGRKIGNGFKRHDLGDPYNLRHCYARRCLELGLTSDVSAALMGHSREIHERSYRSFIHSTTYLDVAKRITGRARHKPQPY